MSPEQFTKINQNIIDTVESTITKTVNGKIDKLRNELNAYIKEDNDYKVQNKEESDKWRAGADEKLSLVNNIQGFGRVFMYIVGVIVAVGTIYKIFK